MGNVFRPGRDLPHDLLASCTGTLRTKVFPLFRSAKQNTELVILRFAVLGSKGQDCRLRTITCELRPFK